MTTALQLNKVSVQLGGQTIVSDISLELKSGEIGCLLGHSGCGKTTLLRAIAGFEQPALGEIWLHGKQIASPQIMLPTEQRNVGMVFQDLALFPHLTVGQNIAFGMRRCSKEEIHQRTQTLLELVGLPDLTRQYPHQLSGGQQQRIALARALVFEPELVLMDEPLGALDKQLREKMQYEIKHIHQRLGVTIVYVTHDQSEALTMSDRVAVFNDGIIQQLASPADLYERPENSFVAQFIGENNQLAGTVKEITDDEALISLKDGGEVLATPVKIGKNPIGENTLLSIRPERVIL
ncbi:MAG: ABC transporter ATP-binding protein, partial [Gammaproteobacteria bacterium]|nr:ABC transporter ATP-binding protein [Gammaproteobacteria bacterium]